MPTRDLIDNRELEHVKNLLRNSVKPIERTKKHGWRKKGDKDDVRTQLQIYE